jgi:hypothetical protein
MAIRDVLDRASAREPREKPVEVITMDVVEAESARLEAFFAQDLDGFMDAYTDDAIFVDETFGDYLEGKAAIKSMYRNLNSGRRLTRVMVSMMRFAL